MSAHHGPAPALPRLGRRAALLALGVALAATSAWAYEAGFGTNFSDVKLTDQEGHTFSFDQLAGRIVLMNFMFTTCSSVCPVQTRALAEVQAALPARLRVQVHFVSLSLDPLSDTPARLKAYGQKMGVRFDNWHLLTGQPGHIDRVSERLRLFRPGASTRRPEDHATSLWLIDRQGRIVQRYAGNPPDARRLTRELIALHDSRP